MLGLISLGLGALNFGFGASAKQDAKIDQQRNQVYMEDWETVAEHRTYKLEQIQRENNAVTQAVNLSEMARFRRQDARQTRAADAEAQAAAHIGGVSDSSSVQGYNATMGMESGQSISSMIYQYNTNNLRAALGQEAQDAGQDIQQANQMVNQYSQLANNAGNMKQAASQQMISGFTQAVSGGYAFGSGKGWW